MIIDCQNRHQNYSTRPLHTQNSNLRPETDGLYFYA